MTLVIIKRFYYVMGTIPSTLCGLSHSVLIEILKEDFIIILILYIHMKAGNPRG